jgi:hypothetical protein
LATPIELISVTSPRITIEEIAMATSNSMSDKPLCDRWRLILALDRLVIIMA